MNDLARLPKAFDAVVVGARIAGASTAFLLARHGLSVLVVDRASYGSDTLSTHALMRAGVAQLARWRLLDRVRATRAVPIRNVAFHYGDRVVDIPIADANGVDALYAPLRTDLDPILVDAAREAGADVRHHVKLVDLVRSSSGAIAGVELSDRSGRVVQVETPLVIGADGRRSDVARLVGAPVYRWGRHAAHVVYGHFHGLDEDRYHWYFRPGVSAGVIPSSRGQCCVFVSYADGDPDGTREVEPRFHRLLERVAPDLQERLAGDVSLKGFRTFSGQPSFLRQSVGEGWALVGDAGYFKDPCTAHGMTDALVDAELLARAVVEGTRASLDRYQSTRDALSAGLLDVTDAIASFEWDLPLLQSYHRVLSEEMNRKLEEVAGFDAAEFRAA